MRIILIFLIVGCAPAKYPEVITKTVIEEKIVKVKDDVCEAENTRLKDDVEYYRKRWIEHECNCD